MTQNYNFNNEMVYPHQHPHLPLRLKVLRSQKLLKERVEDVLAINPTSSWFSVEMNLVQSTLKYSLDKIQLPSTETLNFGSFFLSQNRVRKVPPSFEKFQVDFLKGSRYSYAQFQQQVRALLYDCWSKYFIDSSTVFHVNIFVDSHLSKKNYHPRKIIEKFPFSLRIHISRTDNYLFSGWAKCLVTVLRFTILNGYRVDLSIICRLPDKFSAKAVRLIFWQSDFRLL